MWKRAYRGAKEADAAISLGSWAYKAVDFFVPTAVWVLVSWIAWFWNSYGVLGAIFCDLGAAVLLALTVWLAGLARQSWRPNLPTAAPLVAQTPAEAPPA